VSNSPSRHAHGAGRGVRRLAINCDETYDGRNHPRIFDSTPMPLTPAHATATDILQQVEAVLIEAEDNSQTGEVDPYRGRVFGLFARAEALGGLADDADPDLSAEAIARHLADSWNMARELGAGALQPSRLPPHQLARLRSLWAFMRIWSEWTYAWRRWPEFHSPPAAADRKNPDSA
jgi:hypothetical protein